MLKQEAKAGLDADETQIFTNMNISLDEAKNKVQGNGLGHYYAALVRGGEIVRGRLAHFLMNGERGKGKRHHKRHGKNYRVHIAIISHIGHLQQFCYIYVTLLWLLLAEAASNMPVIESKCDCGLKNSRVRAWTGNRITIPDLNRKPICHC